MLYLNWAPPELCQAAAYLGAIGKLLPPPPPGAPGPFALSERDAIVRVFDEAGLDVASSADVTVDMDVSTWTDIVAGRVSAPAAAIDGKIMIAGDIMKALALDSLL